MNAAEAALRERAGIGGDLSQILFDEFCNRIGDTLNLPSGDFRVLYQEECVELGYPDDGDPYGPLVIRRESDGKCFEIDLEAAVSVVPTPEEREAHRKRYEQLMVRVSGQQSLPLDGAR